MINKISAILAIAIAFAPATSNAKPSEPTSFTYRGQTYTYTTEQVGSKNVIRGQVGLRRERFELYVGKNWVEGTVNGNDVSFSRRSVVPVQGIVTVENLAMR